MRRKQLLPPACFFIAILLMGAAHFLVPVRKVIPPPYNYLGALLVLVGLVLNIWSSNLFNKAKTTIKPFEKSAGLVTDGPYRISRHPMYLGMTVSLAGLAVLLGSVTPAIVIPAFVWVMAKEFIPVEEQAMEETFGDAWREYKKRVRRWL